MQPRRPQRIVCLTEETTEVLYLLGEQERICGISGYTVRPPEARRDKPRVCAYTSARLPEIIALRPDLVLGFSDLQADIAAALVRAGCAVHVFNQRSVQGILDMIVSVGALVGAGSAAEALAARLGERVEAVRAQMAAGPRPRIYFEEWDSPRISCIGWVSELIGVAGGDDCFPELAAQGAGRDRIIADDARIIARMPDIMIGSWCGKRFRPERVRERPGWDAVPAVRSGALHEIKSAEILQPGPAALTDGLDRLVAIVSAWREGQS